MRMILLGLLCLVACVNNDVFSQTQQPSPQADAIDKLPLSSKQRFDLKLRQQLDLARARYRERLRRAVAEDKLPSRIQLGDLPIQNIDPPRTSEELQRRTLKINALKTTLIPQLNQLLQARSCEIAKLAASFRSYSRPNYSTGPIRPRSVEASA